MYRKEKFSVVFKLECIELHKNFHRSIGSIAIEKGFNESNLRKWIIFYNKYGSPGTAHITDYLDGFQYSYLVDGKGLCITCRTDTAFEEQAYNNMGKTFPGLGGTPEWKLDFVPTAEGFYSFTENRYIYQYRDHLGNARVSFAKNSEGVLEVTDTNNYYPFGLNHIQGMLSSSKLGSYYSYKYNGKELQETGMYDYGARFYMPDLGRWGVVDPLSENMRRHSPYNYGFNNPLRFIDPDGRQAEDKIKIFNNGNIERKKDDNAYDTITNEDESKSIQIARTNVSESNPTGDSQIGEAKTVPYNTPGHDGVAGGTEFTYMQIQDYDVATQVFEFAANNTSVELGQDTFNFSDGFSTNIVGTNHSINESASAADVLENNNLGGSGFHITKDAIRQERVHSHPPGSEWGPSGFNAHRDKKQVGY
ncbi:RHS repeat-associated core domain-containing protein [Chryseobacterium carnipullorum]|uniref:RHS repeat-associated core domain-containing protein n=1 Tax=Chryseobacterium carnipullorum TaxID=1124835 RepID=UPI0009321D88|nr:RHS repeat-associated core domain-containing protein [Chryseobacterium carnipullorum]